MPRPSTTLFEDAIDVPLWLEGDAGRPLAERRQRDRAIGRGLAGSDPATRVRLWWRQLDRGAAAPAGERLRRARRWLSLAAAAAGLASGCALALVAFRYDGTQPVNVVRLLGLLVVPQTVLLVLTLWLLPGRLPGLGAAQDALAAINPGAVIAGAYRHFARSSRDTAALFGWATARSAAARRFAKWQIVCWSQIAAVGFNIAVIATAATLIAFTDLAFGWSTTLTVKPEAALRIAGALARPWASLIPSAVPDAALIEQSQFFRLEGAREFGAGSSRVLAGWWSFTLMAVLVYGLLPRVALLTLGAWRLRAATRRLLLEDARVTALLDRMDQPDVETQARDAPPHPHDDHSSPELPTAELRGPANGVIWSQALPADAAAEFARTRLRLELGAVAEAGGGQSLDAERAALGTVVGETGSIVVFTPAWEPPVLEFGDFLAALRKRIGPAVSIVVVPVGEGMAPSTPLERDTWAHAIARAADPRVYLETGDA
jgi:hypothetical protein